MSIRETKPGVYDVNVYLGISDRTPQRARKRVRGTKKDAQEVERKLGLQENKSPARISTRDMSVADFLVRWMDDYVRPLRAKKTIENYEGHIVRLNPFIGNILLRKLRPEDIQSAYTKLSKTTSVSTIRGAHRVLHAALQRAYKNDLIATNVADLVEQPRPSKFHPRVLTPEEAEKLLEAAKGSQHYELLAITLYTGMRLGELASLTWKNVDLVERTLEVEQSKTEAGYRTVYLPSSAVEVLKTLYTKNKHGKDDYVFVGKTGNKVCEDSMSTQYLRRITEKAGLPRMRFHDLRHTHATWLAGADVSARTVADRLGHVDPSFTLRTYAHASNEAQRRVAALIGNILKLPGSDK